jgi:hypothetical protein
VSCARPALRLAGGAAGAAAGGAAAGGAAAGEAAAGGAAAGGVLGCGGEIILRIEGSSPVPDGVLEYNVETRDAGDAPIACIDAPAAPSRSRSRPASRELRQWYRRRHVIAGAGAVVAAGITGIAVAATRGPARHDTLPRLGRRHA